MNQKLKYEPPTLEPAEMLRDVVEGTPPVVSGQLAL